MNTDIGIYIGGLICVYFAKYITTVTRYRIKLFSFLAVLAVGCIAIFRGQVGTDTAMYEAIIELSRDSFYDWEGREPGFTALAHIFSSITESNVIAVRMYAIAFVCGLLAIVSRSDKDETFFIFSYFIPIQFFDYSMNIIRAGLASIFILFAMQALRRGRSRGGLFYFIASCFFHYSSIISMAYFYMSTLKLDARRLLYLLILLVVLLTGAYYFLGDYLILKFSAYSDYRTSGDFSGLSDVIVLAVLMFGVLFSNLDRSSRLIYLMVTLVFVTLSFLLARQTVAGTRILDLLVVVAPVSLLVIHSRQGKTLNLKIKFAFLIAGGLGAVATLRNFMDSAGQDRSPWIPYEVFF